VLSQPASASICERINSEFAFVKDRRRNRLDHDRANKLVDLVQVSQTSAVATRSQPPKPASLRDARFAPRVVVLGCGFSLARVWLCEDL